MKQYLRCAEEDRDLGLTLPTQPQHRVFKNVLLSSPLLTVTPNSKKNLRLNYLVYFMMPDHKFGSKI